MFNPGFPQLVLWLIFLLITATVFYYGAIVSGLYKDPLMARFRVYGEEKRPYPICRLLETCGFWSVLAMFFDSSLATTTSFYQGVFPPLIFFMLAVMSFGASIFVRRRPPLGESLPRWYFDLVSVSTRQERRFIGWAWLRIPPKMRWRLNGDQQAFRVWADMVRITVIYGARTPDDPWAMWS